MRYAGRPIDLNILSILDITSEGKVVSAADWNTLWETVLNKINTIDAYCVGIDTLVLDWKSTTEQLNATIADFNTKYEGLSNSFVHYGTEAPTNPHQRLWLKEYDDINLEGFVVRREFVQHVARQAGQKTPEGGEIFNDYENNQAIAPHSKAAGTNTFAGCRGFNINQIVDINSANETCSISLIGTFEEIATLTVGDILSIKCTNFYIDFGRVTAIAADGIIRIGSVSTKFLEDYENNVIDTTADERFIYNIYKPTVGNVVFDAGQSSEGEDTVALFQNAHAEGFETKAVGRYSHTEGLKTVAAHAAHAEGRGAEALGTSSHAEGRDTKAHGHYGHAEGQETVAGYIGHAEGLRTTASASGAHSEGIATTARAEGAHAEGFGTKATENYAHSEGSNTSANAASAHAEGEGTQAISPRAHAEGYRTVAGTTSTVGYGAHAEGSGTKATANYAHSEGVNTSATATASHAEGEGTQAVSYRAHAEGQNTIAGTSPGTGVCAHAEGRNTKAQANCSHAGGDGTIASAVGQYAVGTFNKTNPDAMFIVGNGKGDSARSNAMEVYKDGHMEVQTQGLTDKSLVQKQYLEEYVQGRCPQVYNWSGYDNPLSAGGNAVLQGITISSGNELYNNQYKVGDILLNWNNAYLIYNKGYVSNETLHLDVGRIF